MARWIPRLNKHSWVVNEETKGKFQMFLNDDNGKWKKEGVRAEVQIHASNL